MLLALQHREPLVSLPQPQNPLEFFTTCHLSKSTSFSPQNQCPAARALSGPFTRTFPSPAASRQPLPSRLALTHGAASLAFPRPLETSSPLLPRPYKCQAGGDSRQLPPRPWEGTVTEGKAAPAEGMRPPGKMTKSGCVRGEKMKKICGFESWQLCPFPAQHHPLAWARLAAGWSSITPAPRGMLGHGGPGARTRGSPRPIRAPWGIRVCPAALGAFLP